MGTDPRMCVRCKERHAPPGRRQCNACRYVRSAGDDGDMRGRKRYDKIPAPVRLRVLPLTDERPRVRGDCMGVERPCPWVGCRYHLLSDEVEARVLAEERKHGRALLVAAREDAFDEIIDRLDTMKETCSLDVADSDEHTLAEVGAHLEISRERVRQIEAHATKRASSGREATWKLRKYAEED